MGHAKEHIMGDPYNVSNVFKYKEVRLNLTGTPEYDPSMAWVAKVREDGRVAADLFINMENFRPTGPNAEECWRAASICNHLDIQYSPLKSR
jgi:hypothetical protein